MSADCTAELCLVTDDPLLRLSAAAAAVVPLAHEAAHPQPEQMWSQSLSDNRRCCWAPPAACTWRHCSAEPPPPPPLAAPTTSITVSSSSRVPAGTLLRLMSTAGCTAVSLDLLMQAVRGTRHPLAASCCQPPVLLLLVALLAPLQLSHMSCGSKSALQASPAAGQCICCQLQCVLLLLLLAACVVCSFLYSSLRTAPS